MERVTEIVQNKRFQCYLKKIEEWEENRSFCKHDKKHFLDVARIAYILYLEEECKENISSLEQEKVKEILYAAGLLHDIGRWQEYEEGIEHQIASAKLAEEILKETDFTEREIREVLTIIRAHRRDSIMEEHSLSGLFYRADKQSRECYWCKAEGSCNWKKEKKNHRIRV